MIRKGSKRLLALSAAVAGVGFFASQSKGELTWDSTGLNPTAPIGGTGVWDYALSAWSNGASDVVWDSSGAIFGGASAVGGVVTINTGTGVLASGLTFSSTSDGSTFTIVGNTANDVLNLGADGVVVNQNAFINTSITGNSDMALSGPAVLQLGASAKYTGATTIAAGTTLQGGAANVFSSNSAHVVTGTLDLGGFNQTIGSLADAGTVQLGVNTLTAGVDNTSTTFSGTLNGGGSGSTFVKAGTGTLTFTSSINNLASQTTVSGGVLDIQVDSALGAGNATVLPGGAIQLDGAGFLVATPITIGGNGVANGGAIRNLANNNTITSVITVANGGGRINSDAGKLTINSTITGNAGQNLTFGGAGNIVMNGGIETGTGQVIKDGSGTLTLSSSSSTTTGNTFSGGLVINGGIATFAAVNSNTVGAGNATGVVPATFNQTAITIQGGGTLQSTKVAGVGSTFITANQGITIGPGGGKIDTVDATGLDPIAGNFLLYVGTIAQGSNTLTKTGLGTLRLGSGTINGKTTGTGAFIIAQGSIRLAGTASVPDISPTSPVTIASGASLQVVNQATPLGSLDGAGLVTMTSGALTVGSLNTNTIFTGSIQTVSATNGSVVSKVGNGTWQLAGPSNSNTWTGSTTVSGGVLQLGASEQIPDGSSVSDAGTIDLNGFTETIGNLSGSGAVTFGAGGSLITGNSANTTFSGTMGGSGGFTKRGSGNFSMTGATPGTYTGGTTVNAGTLSVSNDGNLGGATSVVNIGPATFVATGNVIGTRAFNLTDGAAVLDATSGATLSIGGLLTTTGALNKGPLAGKLQLANSTGFAATSDVNVRGGTLAVGSVAGTATGPLVVPGTLGVTNGAAVAFYSSTTGVGTNSGVVHSINNLNLNNTGILDLGNTAMSVSAATPIATIRQYLTTGYSNGNWNGTSGGGITSTWAANDATHRTAVGYAAQPDGTTLVAATLYGDTTLKGSVGLSDYNTLAANFNKPGVWAQGDFDYDGTVTLADYNKLATNFNKSAQPGGGVAAAGAGAAAKAASVTLTGSASPAASVLPDGVVDPGAGNVVLEANPSTGQLYLVGHDSNINSYEVDSAAGKLTFVSQKNHGGYNTLTAQSGSTGLPGSALGENEDIWATISSAAGTFVAEAYPAGSNPAFDTFGPGLQVFDLNVSGLSAWTAGTPISDLTFKYGNGTGNTLTPAVIPIGVPEPTCLALAGIAAGGLLSRRRKR